MREPTIGSMWVKTHHAPTMHSHKTHQKPTQKRIERCDLYYSARGQSVNCESPISVS